MQYWLMKSEPSDFSIDDLQKCPKQTEPWDGIRNYQVRNTMRDDMKIGDQGHAFAISTTSVIAIPTSARKSLRRVQTLRAFPLGECVYTAYCAVTTLKAQHRCGAQSRFRTRKGTFR